MGVAVLRLPYKLAEIPQPFQLPDGITGKVGLHREQRPVVIEPQAVELFGKNVLVHPAPQGAHLLPGHVVHHLSHAVVRALPGGIPAHHVGHALLRLPVNHSGARVRFQKPDGPLVDQHLAAGLVVIGLKQEFAPPAGPFPQPGKPPRHLARVKNGLAQHAPFPQAVHRVVVGVRVPVALQGFLVRTVQEGVVPVGGLQRPRPGILPVKEPPLQPLQHGPRVEGEHHLLGGAPAPQADVQLIELLLRHL